MSWFVDHPTVLTFTTHYDYDFADLFGRLRNLHTLEQTGNVYVPFGTFAFTYPPGAILLFWPILWVPASHLALLWNVATLVALAGAIAGVLHYLFDRTLLLTMGTAAWSSVICAVVFPPIAECLTWGQTATFIVFMVVLDFLVLRGPAKGVLVGVATALKLYPGLFIVAWLLRREWRAAFTAMGTFALITGLACLMWPKSAETFITKVMIGGEDFQRLTGEGNALKNSSVAAVFSRPPFHSGLLNSDEKLAVSAVVLIVGLIAAHRLWRRSLELSAVVVLLIVSVVGAPIAWDHYFAFAPLLFLMPVELGWNCSLARTSLVAGILMLVPWFIFRQPGEQTAWSAIYAFIARNALTFAAMSVVLVSFADPTRVGSRRRVVNASEPLED